MIDEVGSRDRKAIPVVAVACIVGGIASPQHQHQHQHQPPHQTLSVAAQVPAPPFDHVEQPHPPDPEFADGRLASDRVSQAPPHVPRFVQQRRPVMAPRLPPRRGVMLGTGMMLQAAR